MAVFLGKLTIYLYFCAINIKTEQSITNVQHSFFRNFGDAEVLGRAQRNKFRILRLGKPQINLVFHSTFRTFVADLEFSTPIKYIFKI